MAAIYMYKMAVLDMKMAAIMDIFKISKIALALFLPDNCAHFGQKSAS